MLALRVHSSAWKSHGLASISRFKKKQDHGGVVEKMTLVWFEQKKGWRIYGSRVPELKIALY